MPVPANTLRSKVLTAAAVFVIGAGLHFGQELFVPLALAILLSLILSPLVDWGERVRLPRALAVVVVVVFVFGTMGFAAYLVAGQAASLAKRLPEYRSNAVAKIQAIRVPFSNTIEKLRGAIKDAESVTAPPPAAKEKQPDGKDETVKVQMVETPPSPFKIAALVGGALLEAAGAFALVLLLVVFFLIYKAEIRDRVIRLAGDAQVTIATETINDTARGVSRFLFIQALLNAAFGTVFGLVLYAMGVPGALLWGVLAGVLRFVPYLGPIVAGSLPILLALGVFPGWTRPLMVAGAIVSLEIVQNNFVETVVYGKRAGLSPLAVVLAAVFWTWMWGGIGLLLAVPLTLCLVTVGRHVPSLRFLAVALGDEPALDAKVKVYHRLLGRQQGQAGELLERELAERKSFPKLCDDVVLPVIRMAETDIQEDKLDDEKAQYVFAALRQIVDDLVESMRQKGAAAADRGQARILCLPAGSRGDELSAHMLAQVLGLDGFRSAVAKLEDMAGEQAPKAAGGADLLVMCISPPSNLLRVRNLYSRLRRRYADIPIVQGLWGSDTHAINGRLAPDGKATLVSSFVDAEKAIRDLAAVQGAT